MKNKGPVPERKMHIYRDLLAIADHLENVPNRVLLEAEHIRELWAMSASYREAADRWRSPVPIVEEWNDMVRGVDLMTLDQLQAVQPGDTLDMWGVLVIDCKWRLVKVKNWTNDGYLNLSPVTDSSHKIQLDLSNLVLGPDTVDFKMISKAGER